MNTTNVSVKLSELPAFVDEFLANLHASKENATVLALQGDLGAGKTTFVKALAKKLGVSETVTSPTFTIFQIYDTADTEWNKLIHMDAYRIDDRDELKPLRFAELLQEPETLFCIEWAEKLGDAIPVNTIKLSFSATEDEEMRIIQIEHKV